MLKIRAEIILSEEEAAKILEAIGLSVPSGIITPFLERELRNRMSSELRKRAADIYREWTEKKV